MILKILPTTLRSPSMRLIRESYVGMILTVVMIFHHGSRLSMSENRATIKTMMIIIVHIIRRVSFDVRTAGDLMKVFNDEFIKSSVEDLVLIPKEKAVTFSNPLFNSNDDFISSDDESLSDEDVPEDNVKIYSNPLFEFDDEYISSDVNPLFDEVLEDIECKDSYDPNLDESTFLVTPLSDSNEDEYFTPGDDVELLLYHDPSIPKMSVASILEGFTDEPPLEENDDLFDLKSKNYDWKKILYDAPILMTEDKYFDLEIHDQNFLQHMSEDTIFDPGIFAFIFLIGVELS
nr:hypothetical protein [Tanacetum cinerariifolium]